jgi:hypothetical protein
LSEGVALMAMGQMTAARSKILTFYEPSLEGVLRSLLWCLLFLVLFSAATPRLPRQMPLETLSAAEDLAKGGKIIPRLTAKDDHQTVLDGYSPDPRKRHIAWITDSAGLVLAPDKNFFTAAPEDFSPLAKFVARELESRHGMRDFDIPLYLRVGIRPMDFLVLSLLALREKPDLIVMPINHVWFFSHYQVANPNSFFNLAPELWLSRPELWSKIPLFCSPAQDLWALLGSRLAIIRDAVPVKKALDKDHSGLFHWLYGGAAVPARSPDPDANVGLLQLNLRRGATFSLHDASGKTQMNLVYRAVMDRNSPQAENSFATAAFFELISILKESGVPVLIYDSPLADYFYGFPATAAKIRETQEFLESTAKGLSGTNVRIIARVPEPVRRSITFRKNDGFHADDPGNFSAFLADQIWLMLKQAEDKKDRSGK